MSDNTYLEPARRLPILGAWDVVVCGGGPAGCAAAIAAARQGAKTLLLEKEGCLGGTTVNAAVSVILSTNGADFQGVWHEWAARLNAIGGITQLFRAPSHLYKEQVQWWRSAVDPEKVKWVWETFCDEVGVQLLYGATIAGAIVDAGRVTGVVIETISGRAAVMAARVVDATGDAAVSWHAGVPWKRPAAGDKPWPQAVSMITRWGRRDKWDQPPQALQGGRPERLARLDKRRVDPLNPWHITDALRSLRQDAHDQAMAGPSDEYLVATPPTLGIRATRTIVGAATVGDEDAWTYRKHADGIARSSWEIDIHAPDDDALPDRFYHSASPEYRRRNERTVAGEYFDVPYGCLLPQGVENLLVAGRCISASPLAHASLRIQQTCMSIGQAAGTAAAMSLSAGVKPRDLSVPKLLAKLEADRMAVRPAFDCLSAKQRMNVADAGRALQHGGTGK